MDLLPKYLERVGAYSITYIKQLSKKAGEGVGWKVSMVDGRRVRERNICYG